MNHLGYRDKKKTAVRRVLKYVRGISVIVMILFVFTACEGSSAVPLKDPNAKSANELLAGKSVIFSVGSGFYNEGFGLEMTVNEDVIEDASKVSIYYTVDGTDPADSPTRILYDGAVSVTDRSGDENNLSAVDPDLFTIRHTIVVEDGSLGNDSELPAKEDVDKCSIIRAVCVDKSGKTYGENQGFYFVGDMSEHVQGASECASAGWDFFIISIQMDEKDLLDYDNGIYVKGAAFDEAVRALKDNGVEGEELIEQITPWTEANYNMRGREWEKTAALNILKVESDGSVSEVITQNCGIRIQGHASRSAMQKSFRLFSRVEYGSNDFTYPFFGENLKDDKGECIDTFNTLILRSGYNGPAYMSKCEDAMLQDMLYGSGMENVEFQKTSPCVVYLNGEYWGVYNLTSDYCAQYIASIHGLKKDNVLFYKMVDDFVPTLEGGKLPAGVTDEMYYFRDLNNYFDKVDGLENDEDYEEFCKLVDPDSFLEYFAAEVWLNNMDWPDANWIMWRTIEKENDEFGDTRWRMALNDLDQCGSFSGEAERNTITDSFTVADGGLLAKDTPYLAVKVFAYLMSNEGFKERYKAKLLEMSADTFSEERVNTYFEKYEHLMCDELLEQHYRRYPSDGSVDEAREHFDKLHRFMGDRPVYIWPMQNDL